jgi:hypothetical protein
VLIFVCAISRSLASWFEARTKLQKLVFRHVGQAPTFWATPGRNHPDDWVGGLAGDDIHTIAILFARDDAEQARATSVHEDLLTRCDGVRRLSFLDLNATPPFNDAHDHFGFRDRLSQPVMEGSGEEPTPGSGAPLKRSEFVLGYPEEFAGRQSGAAGGVVPQRRLHGAPAAAGT